MTAERYTIYDLVSDVEDDITNMEGYASLLQLAADGVASHHGQEAGDGLIRLATETNACVRRLREWHREAHAAVVGQRQEPITPTAPPEEPRESIERRVRALQPWSDLYSRWLKHQAYSEGLNAGHEAQPGDSGGDYDGDFLTGEETALVRKMIGQPAVTDWQLAQKIEVLEHITMPDPSDWADKRDRLLLASIKDDVLAMGGRP